MSLRKHLKRFQTLNALGLHYNFFDQLFINNEIENKNINDTFPLVYL